MNPNKVNYYTLIKPLLRNKYVRNYSSLGFSLILIIVFTVFAIKPTLATIISLNASINENKEILKKLQDKSKNIRSGDKNYKDLGTDKTDSIKKLLPEKADLPFLITSINSLAKRFSASISGLQFQPLELTQASTKVKNPKLEEISLTFSFSSNYKTATAFIDSLSTSERLINVSGVNINKKDTGELIITVNGKSYFLK